MSNITDRLERVRTAIAEAAQRANRPANEITLVAVAKGHGAAKLRLALEDGQLIFGESKVQEARAKIPLLPSHLSWQFIGHLQKNKVRHALPLFDLIHSVDSFELGQQMQRVATEDGLYPRILLEVNVAGEGTKFGFNPEALSGKMEQLLMLDRLSIEGLMTIAPIAEEAEPSRRYFACLRELRDRLESEFDVKLPQLSMGMSDDFAIAVEEGSTLVRVGTAIFGARSRKED